MAFGVNQGWVAAVLGGKYPPPPVAPVDREEEEEEETEAASSSAKAWSRRAITLTSRILLPALLKAGRN